MRLKHLSGGNFLMSAQTYNALFTVHGVHHDLPVRHPRPARRVRQLLHAHPHRRARRRLPRLNLLSWYFFLAGACLALLSLFTGHGAPDTGWTFYVPFSIKTGTNVTLAVFAAFVLGFSSMLTGLNFITTIHRMRAPGMTWHRMPLFVWSLYATGWIQVLATPIIGHHLGAGHPGTLLQHRRLRPGQGRRPAALPAHVLDLLPSRRCTS